jgi:hypothetical protein
VTVAGWPSLTLLMSDSLNATVIVIVPVFTISANDEPDELEEFDELDELELPRLPAVAPVPLLVEELDDELLLEPLDDVDPAETESPGWRLDSDTIVPLIGAYSFVFLSAALALCTLALAP